MSSLKKGKVIATIIIMTLFIVLSKFFEVYSVSVKNKLALMQFENNDMSYSVYRFLANSENTIQFIIIALGFIICILIFKGTNLFKKNK